MRLPTLREAGVVLVLGAALWVAKSCDGSADELRAELRTLKTTRDSLVTVNGRLTDELERVDAVAAVEIPRLEEAIEEDIEEAADAGEEGAAVAEEALALVPDSMPILRRLIVRRELLHVAQVRGLERVIARKDSIMAQMGGQLTAARALAAGLRTELWVATNQIEVLTELADPPMSNLEAAALGAGAYIVTTDGLGGDPLEGLIAGGITFVGVKGVSHVWRWIFR